MSDSCTSSSTKRRKVDRKDDLPQPRSSKPHRCMEWTQHDEYIAGPQPVRPTFQLFGRPERMYPAWLWLTGLAMENHHFLSSVNHLFRLGPSKNHGELLVITRPGKCRHSWLVISLDLDVKGDTIKNLEKARQMIEKKGHSETAQATSYSYLSYSYLSFFSDGSFI